MKRMPSAVSMSSHLPSSGIWTDIGPGNFPLPTSIFKPAKEARIGGYIAQNLHLIDIGKPETLAQARKTF